MKLSNRNYSIDLLRILCMLAVIFWHILLHGQVLYNPLPKVVSCILWLLVAMVHPCINCFVISSGFLLYSGNDFFPKLKNTISLYFTVLFYSVFICLGLSFLFPERIGNIDIVKSFFPISTGQYWFFSSYFGMILVSPIINQFVYNANRFMLYICVLVIGVFSVISTLFDPFIFYDGYCFVWFALLYLVGAIIKKEDLPNKISRKTALVFIISSILIPWIIKIISLYVDFQIRSIHISLFGDILLLSHCSPLFLLAAIGWFSIFYKLKTSKRANKIILFFASSISGVYMIHDNVFFRKLIFSNLFLFINNCSPLLILLIIPSCVIIICILCTLVDKVRALIFRLLHVERLSAKIEVLIKTSIKKSFTKLQAME